LKSKYTTDTFTYLGHKNALQLYFWLIYLKSAYLE